MQTRNHKAQFSLEVKLFHNKNYFINEPLHIYSSLETINSLISNKYYKTILSDESNTNQKDDTLKDNWTVNADIE